MAADRHELLREGLLAGTKVAFANPPAPAGGSLAGGVADRAAALGANVTTVALSAGEEAADELLRSLEEIVSAPGYSQSPPALVIDASGAFARTGGRDGLISSLAATWNAARGAGLAFIAGGGGGRIVAIGPPATEDHAGAAVAGLENLARTLSIEWARHGITSVAIAPAAGTSANELATLVCWLLSPAGAYFSGCLLDLRGAVAD
jgi:hypothetical protein